VRNIAAIDSAHFQSVAATMLAYRWRTAQTSALLCNANSTVAGSRLTYCNNSCDRRAGGVELWTFTSVCVVHCGKLLLFKLHCMFTNLMCG